MTLLLLIAGAALVVAPPIAGVAGFESAALAVLGFLAFAAAIWRGATRHP